MSNYGDFTEKTFVNGSTAVPISAENLNAVETKLEAIDNHLAIDEFYSFAKYKKLHYEMNCKTIDDMQNTASWTSGGGTMSSDTANFIHGSQGVKCLENDNTASWIGMYKTISSIDLTTFENSFYDSNDDDHIMIGWYMSNIADWDYFQYKLGTDNSNNYSLTISPPTGLVNGFNAMSWKKSDFTTNGSPAGWDDITYLRIEGYTKANKQNTYFTVTFLGLIRYDSLLDKANPLMIDNKYYSNLYNWKGLYTILQDSVINELVLVRLDPWNDTDSDTENDLSFGNANFFLASFEGYTKEANKIPNLSCLVNTSNYYTCYQDTNMKIKETIGGAPSTIVDLVGVTVPVNGYCKANLELNKDNELIYIVSNSYESKKYILDAFNLPSENFQIFLGHSGTASRFVFTNFVVCNSIFKKDNIFKFPIFVKPDSTQTINNSTSLTNITGLKAILDVGFYEVDAWIVAVNSSSATPDLKCDWELTNITQVTGKRLFTVPPTTTNVIDSNVMSTIYDLTSDSIIGVDGTVNETVVHENFIIKVTKNGGILQFRAAQNTANASDTNITQQSSLKITKLSYDKF